MLRSLQRFTIRQVYLNISLTAQIFFRTENFLPKQKKHKKANITNPPNTKMNQEHDITALINNGLRRGAVDTKQHVQVNHRIQVLQEHVKNYTADDQRKPSFITTHIPSREKQRLGLRIEEMDDVTISPDNFQKAITYVTKVKTECTADDYSTFLDVLHQYKSDEWSIEQVVDQVSHLFRNHNPELLTEFALFLPDEVKVTYATMVAKL